MNYASPDMMESLESASQSRYGNRQLRVNGRLGEQVIDMNTIMRNLENDSNFLNKYQKIRLNN